MNENIEGLIRRLLIVGHEADYLEFKKNFNKDDLGERISGIANACAIADRETGYIIFGIDDKSLKIVSTDFCPDTEKFGNMPIQNWLYQFLEPKINFEEGVRRYIKWYKEREDKRKTDWDKIDEILKK